MISENMRKLVNLALNDYSFENHQNLVHEIDKLEVELAERCTQINCLRDNRDALIFERDNFKTHWLTRLEDVSRMDIRIRELEKTRPRIVVRTWEAHSGPYGCFYDLQEMSPNGKPWSYWSDRNNKAVHPDVIEHVLNSALEAMELVREEIEKHDWRVS